MVLGLIKFNCFFSINWRWERDLFIVVVFLVLNRSKFLVLVWVNCSNVFIWALFRFFLIVLMVLIFLLFCI